MEEFTIGIECGQICFVEDAGSTSTPSACEPLRACQKRDEVKALLMKRHEHWKQNASLVVVQAPAQLGLWDHLTDDPGTLQRA